MLRSRHLFSALRCQGGARCISPFVAASSSSLLRQYLTSQPACAKAIAHASLCTPSRFFTQTTRPLRFELDPSQHSYVMEHAFEEPTFRFLCEGVDVDFKNEVREALSKIIPACADNFSGAGGVAEEGYEQTLRRFRALCEHHLVSYAQVRSTPRRLASFVEVLATADPHLAILAAEHFTFAGLVATHAKKEVRDVVLQHVDSGRTIGCLATKELIAEGDPLNTEARYDFHGKHFVLRGTGKFAVSAASTATWAIVSATLTLKKQEHNGTHLFLVRLREDRVEGGGERKDGALPPLCAGIRVEPIGEDTTGTATRTGAAMIHFDDVQIPEHCLLEPFSVTAEPKVAYSPGQDHAEPATHVLQTRRRLATGSLYVGQLKALLTNVVRYTANTYVCGPDYRRSYPYFGLQHIQTPLVSLVANSYVYIAAWQQLLDIFTKGEAAGTPPGYEDHMRLAGIVHVLQETLMELHQFASETMGVHGSLASSGTAQIPALVHARQEGPDLSFLMREVAFKSITKNIGTTHWGWWLTNFLQPFAPALDRFFKNPMYSPRIADLGRHLLFFSHKHYTLKKRLRQSREMERRKGGPEHQWYDWVMFRHRDVVHCGEAFMEMYMLDIMMKETERCTDPRGRKLLRDMGWIYALGRQMRRLDFILASRMLSHNKAIILSGHFDNLVTTLAPQCVHLVEAMEVPDAFLGPCALEEKFEAYWTIPGTNTHIERGDRLTLHDAAKTQQRGGAGGRSRARRGDPGPGGSKADQEAMKESGEEFDLFHGLADEPSYARRKMK